MKLLKITVLTIFIFGTHLFVKSNEHPGLLLTSKGVKEIKAAKGKYPAFDASVSEMQALANTAVNSSIEVPQPKDGGGGYTHEKHKNNYYQMNACGIMYQLTGKTLYAQFVKEMLLKYAEMYPNLGLHPAVKSSTPGKIFWQALNEAVWLVHTANAYDCVYNYINQKDRQYIENNLFYPVAEFISNGNPENYAVFNMMHNHGTWATAAVGMIGYAMGDKNLVEKALYGSKKDGKTGFIKQLDVLFSPDGYFTEGPYYQRYSIWPFITFAQVIENKQPELRIFKYRNEILNKAVNTLLQCTYNGEIIRMNDALLKNLNTQEIIYAVNIAYKNNPSNISLLSIAQMQNSFIISDAGIVTAKALKLKKAKPFEFKSILLSDGEKGDEGGIAIFRQGEGKNQTCLTFKATSHGLSHGHFDKLTIGLFDNGNEILTDYGAVRFLNIEPKFGGHYTKENESWAKQTIAHNTATIDQKSHFDADIKISEKFHSEILFSDFSKTDFQIISAIEKNAAKDVIMQRTVSLLKSKCFEFPVVIDIFKVLSNSQRCIDLPFHYSGQVISTSFNAKKISDKLQTFGLNNGYQHLWLEASAKTDKPLSTFTFVKGSRFYSISSMVNSDTEFYLTRLGANDPEFNFRPEAALIIRQPASMNHTFVNVVEPHGLYDLTKEVTSGYRSFIYKIEKLVDNDNYTAIRITTTNNKTLIFVTVNQNFDHNKIHNIKINNTTITFTGNYYYSEN